MTNQAASSYKATNSAIVGLVLVLVVSLGLGLRNVTGLRTGEYSILATAALFFVALICGLALPLLLKRRAAARPLAEAEAKRVKEVQAKSSQFKAQFEAETDCPPVACTYLGGTGLAVPPNTAVLLTCSAERITIAVPETLFRHEFDCRDLTGLEISGPGTVTTNAGVAGGGFGLEGFLKGALVAAAVNVLTTKSTTNTFLRLQTRDSEAFFHTAAMDPTQLRVLTSPAHVKASVNAHQHGHSTVHSISHEIEKLHRLMQAGALSAAEFDAAKQSLLKSSP